jgi:hypothetical protein
LRLPLPVKMPFAQLAQLHYAIERFERFFSGLGELGVRIAQSRGKGVDAAIELMQSADSTRMPSSSPTSPSLLPQGVDLLL